MKNKHIVSVMAVLFTVFGSTSCDVESEVFDRVSSENFPSNQAELLATVGPAYGGLRRYAYATYELNLSTSDEMVAPTRGQDWDDQGSWRSLEQHTWTADRPGNVNGAWEQMFTGIASVNIALKGLAQSSLEVEGKQTIQAELRVLRAFYYYVLCDLFGRVPIITDETQEQSPKQSTRQEVYAFIEREIKAALPNLNRTNNVATYGRVTKGAAHTLLAKLYLNAQVFAGAAKWAEVITSCDSVINSNEYALNENFFDNFSVTNRGSAAARRENIFIVPFDKVNYKDSDFDGFRPHLQTLHFAQRRQFNLGETPWNGFCTIAEFYNSFSPNDERKKMWLEGVQRDRAGNVIKYDDGVTGESQVDLNFQVNISALNRATQRDGVRGVKYQVQQDNNNRLQDNHFAIFRYADVLMMKAEALVRLGRVAEALPLVNQVRSRARVSNFTSLTLDDILAERGREFAWESWRRNDLIRFDKFANGTWTFKSVSPKTRELFPIPTQQLARNPSLTQNPGY